MWLSNTVYMYMYVTNARFSIILQANSFQLSVERARDSRPDRVDGGGRCAVVVNEGRVGHGCHAKYDTSAFLPSVLFLSCLLLMCVF